MLRSFSVPTIELEKMNFLVDKNSQLLNQLLLVKAEFESLENLVDKRNMMIPNREGRARVVLNNYIIPLDGNDKEFVFITEIITRILNRLPTSGRRAIAELSNELEKYNICCLSEFCR